MFLQLSVILFTGGVCIPACNGADTPPPPMMMVLNETNLPY